MQERRSRHTREQPHPFLKWAGGKRTLLPEILEELPPGPIDLYVEPFLGGGALFCELARQGRIRRAVLGDRNPELIGTWREVQRNADELYESFCQWETDETTYYAVRALDPQLLTSVDRAGRVLYLNRVGFNGLYRLNSSGRFNVPFGQRKGQPDVNLTNLRLVHQALQGVELVEGDFDLILARAEAGAVVYCDPPYWPVSLTSNFNFYDGIVFGRSEQERLAASFRALADRGVHGLLSNADVPQVRALYEGLPVRQVSAARSINRDADKRGKVFEVLVRSGR